MALELALLRTILAINRANHETCSLLSVSSTLNNSESVTTSTMAIELMESQVLPIVLLIYDMQKGHNSFEDFYVPKYFLLSKGKIIY